MLDEHSYNHLAIDTEATERAFLARVYAWMMGALILTMMAAWATIDSSFLMVMVENPALRIGLLLGNFALVIAMTPQAACAAAQSVALLKRASRYDQRK